MRKAVTLVLTLLALSTARADDLDNLDALSQAQFEQLAGDIAGVTAYRAVQVAEPYGAIGFDIGVETSVVQTDNDAVWRLAGVDDASSLPMFRISATKGLPLNFDVGGFIATVPGTGIQNVGAQLRYALLEGGVVTPAVGLRAAVTRMSGVDDLASDTRSLDVSISKGFGPVTPYAGYGRVWASADPSVAGLAEVDISENRAFVGARFTFVVLQLALEAEQLGDTTGYSMKLAFGF